MNQAERTRVLRGRNIYLDRIWNPSRLVGVGGQGAPAPSNGNGSAADALGVITPPPAPVQIYPWWLYESPGATDFYIKSLNFAVPANSVTVVPNFSFQVTTNNVAVLKHIAMTVQASLATINLSLTLLLNNAPIQGWTGIAFPPIVATGVIIPYNNMVVRLPENSTLTAIFTETSGLAWTCSLEAMGWQVSKPEVARLQGSVNY